MWIKVILESGHRDMFSKNSRTPLELTELFRGTNNEFPKATSSCMLWPSEGGEFPCVFHPSKFSGHAVSIDRPMQIFQKLVDEFVKHLASPGEMEQNVVDLLRNIRVYLFQIHQPGLV